jgi:hypothetical protein
MAETKGSILRFSIAFALRGVGLKLGRQFLKLGLSEAQRYDVADRTIAEMRKFGQWKELDDPVEPDLPGPRHSLGDMGKS